MPLTDMQKDRISRFIPAFKTYLASSDRVDDIQKRNERIDLFGNLLSLESLEKLSELEFGRVISSLWAFAMWGNKGYLVDKLLQDNPVEQLRNKISNLLWRNERLATRYDTFRNETNGFGPSSVTELLSFTHPEKCGLWNTKARRALQLLAFSETFPTIKNAEINGEQYEKYCDLLHAIGLELERYGLGNLDLLGINYFLFEVWNSGQIVEEQIEVIQQPQIQEDLSDFDHGEAIDQLLAIGQWLGFEVEKEKTIAIGARVDAIWQAHVANLGVVTYVFEVQRRGNIDSLILNLQRAQNNPTVQRLIVVALKDELDRIKQEISTLREDFRRMVGYMDVTELIRATDLVSDLSGIINKLELVKSEFDNL